MSRELPSDAAIDTSRFNTHWNRNWDDVARRFKRTCRRTAAYEVFKRAIDLIVAGAALILLSPVMACAAVLIKLTDFGPILFVQTRVGEGERRFKCYKFRSMIVEAETLRESLMANNQHDDNRTFKMSSDPRITRIGRILRKTSIDELPQLWNVILGDMSLVGPRPPMPEEVNRYSKADRRRLQVRPGITCIWQVSGRGDLPFREQLRLDVEYIEKRNLALDLKLLLLTIPAVISGRGAY